MNNADIYIEKYKQLETVVRRVYNLKDTDSISRSLSDKNEFRRFKDDIVYCQDVRNFLQHRIKVNNSFSVEPSEQMIHFIEMLIERINKRPHCMDIAIKFANVCWKSYSDGVKGAMTEMRAKLFTHLPIMEDNRVVGVFDENSIFNYIADNEIVGIDASLKFSDIKKYLSLENRDMEVFTFSKSTLYVDELCLEFEKKFKKGQRLGVAFLTASGKASEPLLAMLTPWDMLGNEENL
jgi:hypothetical protein